MRKVHANNHGISLIELTVILVVIGILASVAMKSMTASVQDIKRANTEREIESVAKAIVGDPSITTDGERSSFGYFGDVGAFPPDLQALYSNPGSYTTWHGPYIDTKLAQDSVSFKFDDWGKVYTYTPGVSLNSAGN
ncbi:MAG TPA: type II secretion system protein, partial [Candidatus Acidoferrum sp.]|nr:type II secretion system protein [Candidatus Acidoferrum sp.]